MVKTRAKASQEAGKKGSKEKNDSKRGSTVPGFLRQMSIRDVSQKYYKFNSLKSVIVIKCCVSLLPT